MTTGAADYARISTARRVPVNLEYHCAVQLEESLPVTIRRLGLDDIDQVIAIEKEAFSPLWVSTSFKRDINNKRANYLVACFDDESSTEEILAAIDSDNSSTDDITPEPKLWKRVLGRLGISYDDGSKDPDEILNIAGYVSVWYQGDEAHITEIAVKGTLRGRGVGELLLISSLKAAIEHGSKVMTLEARVSNFIAHRLYQKYSFKSVGIRKAYYSDNREDAVIMTTSPIDTPDYSALFNGLQESYLARWGRMDIQEY